MKSSSVAVREREVLLPRTVTVALVAVEESGAEKVTTALPPAAMEKEVEGEEVTP
jgi:hypothetical protein